MPRKTLKAGLACTGLLFALPAQSFDFKISGQVNSAALFGGDVDDMVVVDNNTSGTRFRDPM